MKKISIFIILAFFVSLGVAQEIQTKVFKVRATALMSIEDSRYLQKARESAMQQLSEQLYAKVNSERISLKKFDNDTASYQFKDHISLSTQAPLIAVNEIQAEVIDGIYHLSLEIDSKVSGPMYQYDAEDLAHEINSWLKKYAQSELSHEKKGIFKTLKPIYKRYKTLSSIASFMGYPSRVIPLKDIVDLENEQKILQEDFDLGEPVEYRGLDLPDAIKGGG